MKVDIIPIHTTHILVLFNPICGDINANVTGVIIVEDREICWDDGMFSRTLLDGKVVMMKMSGDRADRKVSDYRVPVMNECGHCPKDKWEIHFDKLAVVCRCVFAIVMGFQP